MFSCHILFLFSSALSVRESAVSPGAGVVDAALSVCRAKNAESALGHPLGQDLSSDWLVICVISHT